jgi:hypothetical protein
MLDFLRDRVVGFLVVSSKSQVSKGSIIVEEYSGGKC